MAGGETHGWRGVVSAAVIVIATTAAAVSAWSAWQTVVQTQETQLLNRRVEACFEIDRRAAAEIAVALEAVRDAARARASDEVSGSSEGAWGTSYFDGPSYSQCAGTETEKAQCEARWARYHQLSAAADRAESVMGVVRFESSRTFSLLGPPNVARVERALSASLDELERSRHPPLAPEFTQLIDAAVAAEGQFRQACQTSVGAYSAR